MKELLKFEDISPGDLLAVQLYGKTHFCLVINLVPNLDRRWRYELTTLEGYVLHSWADEEMHFLIAHVSLLHVYLSEHISKISFDS